MAELIGDESFVAKFQTEDIPAGVEQIPLTVDREGNVIGDTSHIDHHILAQLSTPEAQAQIRDMYRSRHYAKESPRPVKYLNEREDRRLYVDSKPREMTTKAWRSICRKKFRKMTKATLKAQRSINHG